MDFFLDIAAFALKGLIIFLTIACTAAALMMLSRRRGIRPSRLQVRLLNAHLDALTDTLREAVLGRKALRRQLKERKAKNRDGLSEEAPRVFVLDFKGDLLATAVRGLREEVTAILATARPQDEVVLRLESPGGAVAHYGLAAAQLMRLKEHHVRLTVCVDRVAASGGYLMACAADTIVAAPFAIVGSIGVVAQVPNVHRLLKKHDVDVEEMTAGEFKRTVSLFGEITEKGRRKLQEQLEDTHLLFKEFIKAARPKLDVDRVATGEHWLGRHAVELGLVDVLKTSDAHLVELSGRAQIFQLRYEPPVSLRERVGFAMQALLRRAPVSLY